MWEPSQQGLRQLIHVHKSYFVRFVSYKIRDYVSFRINVSTLINSKWLGVASESSHTERS